MRSEAHGAVRAMQPVVAREAPAPVRQAAAPRLLDLHRTAGNSAVAALVRGADARARAVLPGSGPFDLGDELARAFGQSARQVPIETESAVAGRAEGVTVDGHVHLGPGRFDPTSYEGRVRVGHEVAHAVQQAHGVNSTGGMVPLTRAGRADLEAEAERAGHAFAAGRPVEVGGVAPAGTALFRGAEGQEADGPEPEVEQQLDAAVAQLDARWEAQGATLAAARKQREDWLRAHAEWREFDVTVDERLRKTPASLQPHELDIRLLETALGSISREDAEYVLRRMGWTSRSVEEASTQEQIRTHPKIQYRTQGISLAVEYYNQLIEDRRRRQAYVDELMRTGPDMALEMFKDVGRGVYNGGLGFVQGMADLPLAPVNLVRTIQGKDPVHIVDLGGLRARPHTWLGVHQMSAIEFGTQLGLMLVTAKLPGGGAAGGGGATQTSRAADLFSTWWKVNAVAAGGTAVVQAGEAIRDITRGYVVQNGQRRPLTEDDILQRLGAIAFGAHTAYHAIGGRAGRSSTASAESPTASPDLLIDRPTASTIRVRSPGEPGALVIDDGGWRIVTQDGRVVAQGPPEEARFLASRLMSSDVAAAEPGGTSTPSRPPASSPAGLLEPPKAPEVAGRTADVSPLELPGGEVIIVGRAPGTRAARPEPVAPRPEPVAPEPIPQDRQARTPTLPEASPAASRTPADAHAELLAVLKDAGFTSAPAEVARWKPGQLRDLGEFAARVEPLLGEPTTQAALARFRGQGWTNPLTIAKHLAGIPPERLPDLLRVLADPMFPLSGLHEPHWALLNDPNVAALIDTYGPAIWRALKPSTTGGRGHGVLKQLAARVAREPAAGEALVDAVLRAKDIRAREQLLDIPSPPRAPRAPRRVGLQAWTDDALWPNFVKDAEAFVTGHPALLEWATSRPEPLSRAQMVDRLAVLSQGRSLARRGQFGWMDREQRLAFLDDYITFARETGLTGTRAGVANQASGALSEALFLPPGARRGVRLPHPVVEPGGKVETTLPDYEQPAADRLVPGVRNFVEQKSNQLSAETATGVNAQDEALAKSHLKDAVDDRPGIDAAAAETLPGFEAPAGGAVHSIEYVRVPNRATQEAMYDVLLGPGSPLTAVRFGNQPWMTRSRWVQIRANGGSR